MKTNRKQALRRLLSGDHAGAIELLNSRKSKHTLFITGQRLNGMEYIKNGTHISKEQFEAESKDAISFTFDIPKN